MKENLKIIIINPIFKSYHNINCYSLPIMCILSTNMC